MLRIQLKSEALLLFLVCGALLPFAFLGVDLTDSGYHFINQKLMLNSKDVLQNNAFYWLSDFLAAVVQSVLPWRSFLVFRVLAVGVWGLTAVVFFRFFLSIHAQLTKLQPNFFLLVWCVTISILLSAKPFIEGILLIPDYYTIPVLLMTCLFYFMHRWEQSQRLIYFWLVLALFVALPLARWPLVFSAVLLLVFWAFNSSARRKIFLFLVSYIFAAVVYQQKFLSQFYSSEQQGSQILKIASRYTQDIGELFFMTVFCLGILVFIRAGARYLQQGQRKDLLMAAFLGLCIMVGYNEFFLAKEFYRNGLVLLMGLCSGWLLLKTSGKARALAVSWVLVSGLYFLGSDTGLVKASYLGFFVGAPALYLLLLELPWSSFQRWILIGMSSCLVMLHLWGGLYRDSWKGLLQEPKVVSDESVGWALTGAGKADLIAELKLALLHLPENVERVLILPNSPLLSAYLRPEWIQPGLLWPEIKSSHFLRTQWDHLCNERGETYRIAILSKAGAGPEKGGRVSGSCHWSPVYQGNALFLEKMVYDQGTGVL